jgi:hypothetical protein
MLRSFTLFLCVPVLGVAALKWSPPARLEPVPIRNDCRKTRGAIGLAVQPFPWRPQGMIYWCPKRAQTLDALHPGCARFFWVHEYGHLDLGTRDEGEADAWAVQQLRTTEPEVIRAMLLHLCQEGEPADLYYGTALERALGIAKAAEISVSRWPDSLRRFNRQREVLKKEELTIELMVRGDYVNRVDGILSIDNRQVGFLTNRDQTLVLPAFRHGIHAVQLDDVWLSNVQPGRPHVVVSKGLSARCTLRVKRGQHRLRIVAWGANDRLELTNQ